MKISKLLKRGRRWFFTLALFLLVFAAASVVKIQAAGNVTGWLWGGSEDCDLDKNGFKDIFCGGNNSTDSPVDGDGTINGNETGVGWVSTSRSNCDADNNGQSDGVPAGCPAAGTAIPDYGVTIPSGNGSVTGYAWANAGGNPDNGRQNGLGWIQFDPSGGGVTSTVVGSEKRLSGRARFVEIANALAIGNSGGWEGWIKMAADGTGSGCAGSSNYSNGDRCNYGVKIDSSGNFLGYAWSDELGWIDFSRAKMEVPPTPEDGICNAPPNGQTYCAPFVPTPFSTASDDLCSSGTASNFTENAGGWAWQCNGINGSSVNQNCAALKGVAVVPKCGSPNFCTNTGVGQPCDVGTAGSYSNLESFEVTWTCTGSCPETTISCSAEGIKSCGWIETN